MQKNAQTVYAISIRWKAYLALMFLVVMVNVSIEEIWQRFQKELIWLYQIVIRFRRKCQWQYFCRYEGHGLEKDDSPWLMDILYNSNKMGYQNNQKSLEEF